MARLALDLVSWSPAVQEHAKVQVEADVENLLRPEPTWPLPSLPSLDLSEPQAPQGYDRGTPPVAAVSSSSHVDSASLYSFNSDKRCSAAQHNSSFVSFESHTGHASTSSAEADDEDSEVKVVDDDNRGEHQANAIAIFSIVG